MMGNSIVFSASTIVFVRYAARFFHSGSKLLVLSGRKLLVLSALMWCIGLLLVLGPT